MMNDKFFCLHLPFIAPYFDPYIPRSSLFRGGLGRL